MTGDRVRRHHTYTKARGDLWIAHRVDRDRTTERVEIGERARSAFVSTTPKEATK